MTQQFITLAKERLAELLSLIFTHPAVLELSCRLSVMRSRVAFPAYPLLIFEGTLAVLVKIN